MRRNGVDVRTAIDRFLSHSRARAGKRHVDSQARVLQALTAGMERRRIGELRPRHVAAWQDQRLSQVCRSSVRLEFRMVRRFLSWCVRQGWLEADPSRAVDPPPAPPLREVRFLSREEIQRLREACSSPLREMIDVAVYAGLRPGEIRHLRWGAINGEWIEIRPGDGWNPKRGRERRVPLHPDLRDILYAWRNGGEATDLVFPTRRDTVRTQQDMLRALHQAGERASLDPSPDWRVLRHTFASWLAMEGVSLYHIARFLGHSSVQTTERHYAGLQPEVLRDQIGRLGRIS